MEKKKNILYISERIWRLGLFVLGMMTVMFAFAFFGAIRGKSPIWLAVFSGVAELAYSLTGWFWIIKPYRNSEKIIERFLEGYLISETDGEKAAMLTPYTAEQIKYTEKFLHSPKLMDLNKRQAQYLALQNQINPHFLYNTLESWGIGPSKASTTRITPFTIFRTRSTSPPKSAWPGVSMMLIFVSL